MTIKFQLRRASLTKKNPAFIRIMSSKLKKSYMRKLPMSCLWLFLLTATLITSSLVQAQSPGELDARLREVLRRAMSQDGDLEQEFQEGLEYLVKRGDINLQLRENSALGDENGG